MARFRRPQKDADSEPLWNRLLYRHLRADQPERRVIDQTSSFSEAVEQILRGTDNDGGETVSDYLAWFVSDGRKFVEEQLTESIERRLSVAERSGQSLYSPSWSESPDRADT